MTEERDWLTLGEVAERLGVTQRAVNKYIQQGKLAAYKAAVGNRTLVKVDDFEAFSQPRPRAPRKRAS